LGVEVFIPFRRHTDRHNKMTRIFPIKEWAPSFTDNSRISTSGLSTTYSTAGFAAEDVFEEKSSAPPLSRSRRRLSYMGLGKDVDLSGGFEQISLRSTNQVQNAEKQDAKKQHGGLRTLFRRASVSLQKRRHSHASPTMEERPQTASTWHRLRQATSFNRHSKCFPAGPCFDEDFSTDTSETLSPIPGFGGAPPIIPHGHGGQAARANAAAQNEMMFGRYRQLGQLEDQESGIGIALTVADSVASGRDASISSVDFITALPVELAIQILARLDHTVLVRASRVSKRWQALLNSSHIWREAFIREKSKTYAMSRPAQLGAGLGLPAFRSDHDWKDLYRIKQELERNWLEGATEPIYLNGHTDSIYCVQFDE
jgi:F-box and WD-40 domain protein 1/11